MLVKIAPLGEVVTEVNVEEGSSVEHILATGGVIVNGRSIMVDNSPADEDTTVPPSAETHIITLANKMKGGR